MDSDWLESVLRDAGMSTHTFVSLSCCCREKRSTMAEIVEQVQEREACQVSIDASFTITQAKPNTHCVLSSNTPDSNTVRWENTHLHLSL